MALLLFFARFPWYHRGSEEFYSSEGASRQSYDDLDALFTHARGAKTTWQESLRSYLDLPSQICNPAICSLFSEYSVLGVKNEISTPVK